MTIAGGAFLEVFSGGTANAITVNSGGILELVSGAVTSGIVGSGGTIEIAFGDIWTISPGQVSSGFEPISNGILNVLAGGSAVNITVSDGGTENVSGTDLAGLVTNGGQRVFSGGRASGATVQNHGTQTISSGGTATATFVGISGTQNVASSGTASSTVLSGSHASQSVGFGGAAFNTTVSSGGVQYVANSAGTGEPLSAAVAFSAFPARHRHASERWHAIDRRRRRRHQHDRQQRRLRRLVSGSRAARRSVRAAARLSSAGE